MNKFQNMFSAFVLYLTGRTFSSLFPHSALYPVTGAPYTSNHRHQIPRILYFLQQFHQPGSKPAIITGLHLLPAQLYQQSSAINNKI
ncbi:MAG: hypothetical protein BGO31_12495 [Bacteroidetes bacterium 43-16]|nr:MAG: hypothetical protein BGO31_12495 [Bacteroidetes bacterium 43-16]